MLTWIYRTAITDPEWPAMTWYQERFICHLAHTCDRILPDGLIGEAQCNRWNMWYSHGLIWSEAAWIDLQGDLCRWKHNNIYIYISYPLDTEMINVVKVLHYDRFFNLQSHYHGRWWSGLWFNIKMSYRHWKSHCWDQLIFTMGFPILVRWHLYIESGPSLYHCSISSHSVQFSSPLWVKAAAASLSSWLWLQTGGQIFIRSCSPILAICDENHSSSSIVFVENQYCKTLIFKPMYLQPWERLVIQFVTLYHDHWQHVPVFVSKFVFHKTDYTSRLLPVSIFF